MGFPNEPTHSMHTLIINETMTHHGSFMVYFVTKKLEKLELLCLMTGDEPEVYRNGIYKGSAAQNIQA